MEFDKKNEGKPEYVSNLTDSLEQRHLGEYIPVYDGETDCWCVQTEYGEYSETELQFAQSICQAVSFVKMHNRPMTNAELRENRENFINSCRRKMKEE